MRPNALCGWRAARAVLAAGSLRLRRRRALNAASRAPGSASCERRALSRQFPAARSCDVLQRQQHSSLGAAAAAAAVGRRCQPRARPRAAPRTLRAHPTVPPRPLPGRGSVRERGPCPLLATCRVPRVAAARARACACLWPARWSARERRPAARAGAAAGACRPAACAARHGGAGRGRGRMPAASARRWEFNPPTRCAGRAGARSSRARAPKRMGGRAPALSRGRRAGPPRLLALGPTTSGAHHWRQRRTRRAQPGRRGAPNVAQRSPSKPARPAAVGQPPAARKPAAASAA